MFILEDEIHCEQEQFATFELALAKAQWLAQIPWDERPNRAPCTSWRTCGRDYCIVEAERDETTGSWAFGQTLPIFEISAQGILWAPDFEPQD